MTNKALYQRILRILEVLESDLHNPRHRQRMVEARYLTAAALMQQAHMDQQSVARLLNTTQGSISKMLKRHQVLLEVDKDYKAKWERILER